MRLLLFALLLLLAAPAALAQKDDGKPEARSGAVSTDVAGTWTYTVVPPGDDEDVSGPLTLVRTSSGLTGTFHTDEERKLESAEFDGERLVFTFTQPGMGSITIQAVVTGDMMAGEARVADRDPIPFSAVRAGTDATDGTTE